MTSTAKHARSPLGAELTLAELETDPHAALARLRKREPVSWVPALDGWLVTRRDLCIEVMRDAAAFTVDDPRFSTAQVVGPSMLSLDGDEHRRHRDPFARAFLGPDARPRFAGQVEHEARTLVERLTPAGRAEIRRDLAGPPIPTRTPSTCPGPTPDRTSRSPRVRTRASGSISPGSRPCPRWMPHWMPGPASDSTTVRPHRPASSSESHGHCRSAGSSAEGSTARAAGRRASAGRCAARASSCALEAVGVGCRRSAE